MTSIFKILGVVMVVGVLCVGAVALATEAVKGKIHLQILSPRPPDDTARLPARTAQPLKRLTPLPPASAVQDTSGTG